MLIDRLMKQSQIERELSGREIVVKKVRLSAESKDMDELLGILDINGIDANGNRKAEVNDHSQPSLSKGTKSTTPRTPKKVRINVSNVDSSVQSKGIKGH